MCVTTRRKKISKNSDADFSIGCAIVGSRNTFYPNCSNTSHIRKGINFSNIELPLPNVCEPLTIQEAETRIILDGEAAYSLSQGDKATSDPLDFNPRTNTFLNATNSINSNSKIAQGNTRILGHHLGSTSTEGRVSFRQATRLFHIKNMAKC